MAEYQVYAHLDAIEALPRDRPQRTKIFRFFELLAKAPNTPGDYVEKDKHLREQQVKLVGKYAVTYWFDPPVKTVMIVEIRPAD